MTTATLTLIAGCTAAAAMVQAPRGRRPDPPFSWPGGRRAALSLSWDDARWSQVNGGTAVLDRHGVKATFYVRISEMEKQLDKWRAVVAAGHEIGNHSLHHPCSANFPWSREHALEDYTLDQMRAELLEANRRIARLLGVEPRSFAYPCGQKFVGRGTATRSYVPLVAELFDSGRGWRDEAPNDPWHCDLAQLTGIEMDGRSFEDLRAIAEAARATRSWVVLGGHEMAHDGPQTTRIAMLKRLLPWTLDPRSEIWVAPVGEVARWVIRERASLPR